MNKTAIIIGSGFGGLGLGIRLQAAGWQVKILEKSNQIGGHGTVLEKDGYKFDMGPSLITATELIQPLFQIAGLDMFDVLDMKALNPFYRLYFHDKSYIDYTDDTEKMKSQMATFSRHDANQYDRFLKASQKIYEAVIPQKLGATPFMTLGSMAKFAPKAAALKAILPTYNFASLYFKHPYNRFTYSFHPLFIGGNPFRAPAIYEMIPYLEKKGGVWFCTGGMSQLIKALGDIFQKLGGAILTNHEVREIMIKDGKASGVETKEKTYHSDIVVSNADFIHTYRDLIDPKYRKKWHDKRLSRLKYSMSAFLLYLGVRKQYPELLHHTLILSRRYRALIRDIFDKHILPDDFSMYLHAPSRTDSSMAPKGCESLYVLAPVTNLKADIDWEVMGPKYGDRIIQFLEKEFGLSELSSHIAVKEIFTPEDFKKKTNAAWGSAWGVEPSLFQTAYFRPHNRSEDVKNLYIVGASTHPGAGIPGCLLTSECTASVIQSDFQKDSG